MAKDTKLQKWGNSHGVRISQELLEELGLKGAEGVSFSMEAVDGKLVMTPKYETTPFDKLFEGYDDSQPRPEYSVDDKPVGKEYW